MPKAGRRERRGRARAWRASRTRHHHHLSRAKSPERGVRSAWRGETGGRDRPYCGCMVSFARLKKPLALTAASALGLVGFLAVAKLAKEPWPLLHANLWLATASVVSRWSAC